MSNETRVTVVGRLTADPELRYLQGNGKAVVNFTVATNAREFDRRANEWRDKDPSFFPCSAWEAYAENIAKSLVKGSHVIVTGVLEERRFESKQGEKRSRFELRVEECGPALRWATAAVHRLPVSNANICNEVGWVAAEPGASAPHDDENNPHAANAPTYGSTPTQGAPDASTGDYNSVP